MTATAKQHEPQTDTAEKLSSAPVGAVSTAVAQFMPSCKFEDLPEEAVTQAKLAILDTIGVTLAGVATYKTP